ncbi:MAG: antitoxin [Candidatus Nanopelagicaceae bacterium]|nr:antitoxin [Candidatus Nanopelagicaceae bacterium]
MSNVKNPKAYLAEFFGSALLVAAIVGSGTMGSQISSDSGVGLTLNAISVVAMLWILITTLGPISGAHFNPVVSLVMLYRKAISTTDAVIYMILQILGAIAGATLANLMFEKTLFEISKVDRSGYGQVTGEVVATAGLIFFIVLLTNADRGKKIPAVVAAWIGSAFFFTSSTALANPAVTIGRIFTDSVVGIEPNSVLPFLAAQIVGGAIGLGLTAVLKGK